MPSEISCPVRNGGLSPSPGLGPFCLRVHNWLRCRLDALEMTAWVGRQKNDRHNRMRAAVQAREETRKAGTKT